jgi:hypothetical protein
MINRRGHRDRSRDLRDRSRDRSRERGRGGRYRQKQGQRNQGRYQESRKTPIVMFLLGWSDFAFLIEPRLLRMASMSSTALMEDTVDRDWVKTSTTFLRSTNSCLAKRKSLTSTGRLRKIRHSLQLYSNQC